MSSHRAFGRTCLRGGRMTAWAPGLHSISPSSAAKLKNSFPNGPWPLCLSDLCGFHICPWPQRCSNRRIWPASLKPQATLDTDIKYPHPKLNGLSVEEGRCPRKITALLSGDKKTDTEQAKQQMSILSLRQKHTTTALPQTSECVGGVRLLTLLCVRSVCWVGLGGHQHLFPPYAS